jgi:hypothetical protein
MRPPPPPPSSPPPPRNEGFRVAGVVAGAAARRRLGHSCDDERLDEALNESLMLPGRPAAPAPEDTYESQTFCTDFAAGDNFLDSDLTFDPRVALGGRG